MTQIQFSGTRTTQNVSMKLAEVQQLAYSSVPLSSSVPTHPLGRRIAPHFVWDGEVFERNLYLALPALGRSTLNYNNNDNSMQGNNSLLVRRGAKEVHKPNPGLPKVSLLD